MTAKHSEAFIEQALVKVFSRGGRTIKSVAEDLNVSYHILKYWMKRKSVVKSGVSATKEKRPQDWTAEEQLDRKSTRLNSSHIQKSRMPSSA